MAATLSFAASIPSLAFLLHSPQHIFQSLVPLALAHNVLLWAEVSSSFVGQGQKDVRLVKYQSLNKAAISVFDCSSFLLKKLPWVDLEKMKMKRRRECEVEKEGRLQRLALRGESRIKLIDSDC